MCFIPARCSPNQLPGLASCRSGTDHGSAGRYKGGGQSILVKRFAEDAAKGCDLANGW